MSEAGHSTSAEHGSITRFAGQYSCLSNTYPARLEWMGFEIPTLEHGFHLAKTLDPRARSEIATAPTWRDAKRLGRRVELKPGWEESKRAVMQALLIQKFTRHLQLAQVLLATGQTELVEGNTWGDDYWGVCNGVGRNQLGRQLMQVRSLLHSLATADRSGDPGQP